MPKKTTTPFTYYTFRYDYTDDNVVQKIKQYIINEIPKYALFLEVSQEVGKNHIQGKLGQCISEEQLRKHFKAVFPGVFTKSNYSIKAIKDPESYDSYICKDGKPLCNNVFTPEYIQEQVDKHKVLHTAFVSAKQKKETTLTFTQKVFKDFCAECPLDVTQIQSIYYNPTDYEKKCYDDSCQKLLSFLLKRLGKAVKVFDDNILQRMYNGIKNSIMMIDDDYASLVVQSYKNRIIL